MRKVRIKRSPEKKENYPNNKALWPGKTYDMFSNPDLSVQKTLQPVPRHLANLEAEKGETVYGDVNGDSIPEHFNVGGNKHYNGGTPLNLPANSFIFSDDKDLKVKGDFMLGEFGKGKTKKGYTPAKLAKQYDINDFRRILQDPESDDLQRRTAEMMITNYNMKLGKLALVQESKKGFPQGIPQVAIPFITNSGIDPSMLVHGTPETQGKKHKLSPELYKKLTGGKYQDGGMTAQPIRTTLSPMEATDADMDLTQYFAKQKATPSLGSSAFAGSYANLEQLLSSPNSQALRDAIYTDFKKKLPGSSLSKDEVISNFLTAQKQIYAMQAANQGNPDALKGKSWDKGGKGVNAVYNQTAASLGMIPLSTDQIKAFQATYQTLQDLSADDTFKPMLGEFKFGMGPIGVDDQKRKGEPVSPIDGIFGNTTVGQMVISTKPAATPAVQEEAKKTATVNEPLKVPELANPKAEKPAEWWLQDVIKTAGAFGDSQRIKKYMPWEAPINPYLGDATFYDPTRELAANAEQANIAFQGVSSFAGPQGTSARASGIQGTAARTVADILSKYNNLNVGVANQLESERATTLNTTSSLNKASAQDLYDKTQIVNQQFDNAKAKARENLRQGYIDAVGNRANAQVLNELYPQYNISPISGGMMVFNGGRKLDPTAPSDQNMMDVASDYMKMYPGFEPKDYMDAAKVAMGVPNPGYGYVPDPQYLQNYAGMMSGVGTTGTTGQ